MSQTTGIAKRAADPSLLPPRWARLLRSAVLVGTGLIITFSATFHEQFGFDRAVAVAALAVIGLVHLLEAWLRRDSGGVAVASALGGVSLVAAVLLASLGSQLTFAVGIAAWALVTALLEFVGVAVLPGSRQDAPLVGGVGLLLAATVLLARGDLVAVIGFFGAYAVIAGVFLGIAAFDSRQSAEPEDLAGGTAVSA